MPASVDGKLNEIGRLVQAGQIDKALSSCLTARMEFPQNADLAMRHLRLLTLCGQIDTAVKLGAAVSEQFTQDENIWLAWADALIEAGLVGQAFDAYRKATDQVRRIGGNGRPATDLGSCTGKLRHDLEQLEWLADSDLLPPEHRDAVAIFAAVLSGFEKRGEHLPTPFTPEDHQRIARLYNRLIHRASGDRLDGPAINPDLDRDQIERDYLANGPGMIAVDDLLTPAALEAVRHFCLASTIWFEYRYKNGYLGAFMQDGFSCPLLLQIADELAAVFPAIFGGHTLRKTWAFKCDSRQRALPIHADFAAVNVNFWVTPDSANLEPNSGGLTVWDKEAPTDWDFQRYNTDLPAIDRFLSESGARRIAYPYRCNRAVIFNSDLFHASGDLSFREGYENRRINVTMLFGKRRASIHS